MKACELIERLKVLDPLCELEIFIPSGLPEIQGGKNAFPIRLSVHNEKQLKAGEWDVWDGPSLLVHNV